MGHQLGGQRWQPGLGQNGEEGWAPVSDGGEASESVGSGALLSPSGTPPTWPVLSPLLTHSPRQLFLPRCWRQLWAVEGAPALHCGLGSSADLLCDLGQVTTPL